MKKSKKERNNRLKWWVCEFLWTSRLLEQYDLCKNNIFVSYSKKKTKFTRTLLKYHWAYFCLKHKICMHFFFNLDRTEQCLALTEYYLSNMMFSTDRQRRVDNAMSVKKAELRIWIRFFLKVYSGSWPCTWIRFTDSGYNISLKNKDISVLIFILQS